MNMACGGEYTEQNLGDLQILLQLHYGGPVPSVEVSCCEFLIEDLLGVAPLEPFLPLLDAFGNLVNLLMIPKFLGTPDSVGVELSLLLL